MYLHVSYFAVVQQQGVCWNVELKEKKGKTLLEVRVIEKDITSERPAI